MKKKKVTKPIDQSQFDMFWAMMNIYFTRMQDGDTTSDAIKKLMTEYTIATKK